MKTLSAAAEDFRGNDRDGNRIQDFWTADVSGLYGIEPRRTLDFRWERRHPRMPGVIGIEMLSLELAGPKAGRTYALPGDDIRASYAMESPSRGEGARAVALAGRVSVDDLDGRETRVTLDLRARMERIDAPGVEFDESVRGTFTLLKGAGAQEQARQHLGVDPVAEVVRVVHAVARQVEVPLVPVELRPDGRQVRELHARPAE